ncbi:hypothetical protein B296_00056647, partial [Ensete ventricosum]
MDRPLSGGTTKIDRQQSISAIDDRLKEKSTVGGRLRKKREDEEEVEKKKEEAEKKKEEEKYLAHVPSPPTGRPRAVAALAAHGRLFSPRGETNVSRVGRDVEA